MYYFKIAIPRHEDGRIATYPPRWFGVMAKCPQNVTLHLLNDKEAYLIAACADTFVPPEVEVMSEEEALAELSAAAVAPDKTDTWLGNEIEARWQAQKDAEIAAAIEAGKQEMASAVEGVLNG